MAAEVQTERDVWGRGGVGDAGAADAAEPRLDAGPHPGQQPGVEEADGAHPPGLLHPRQAREGEEKVRRDTYRVSCVELWQQVRPKNFHVTLYLYIWLMNC